ncbi:MAG: hypothetical protein K8R53_15680 [Bacteroidales bacterium]|nr:hypothetical protein [Bacteroidales bacterium]
MFSPGSLTVDGKNLKKDTTLRIIREVFDNTGFNPFIINFFDFTHPKPKMIFKNWSKRERKIPVL